MARHLPHIQRDDTPHFINIATHERWDLPHAARSIALESCRHDHGRTMHLHIAVIMPDHVHLVVSPLIDYDRRRVYPLSEILWAIKSASAHRINKVLGRTGSVWQEEHFDTTMRRSERLEQKMEYVRQNPVRAGIVARPEDYEWTWESPRPRAAVALQFLGK